MKEFFIGTDVGSTTVKIVCLDEKKNIVNRFVVSKPVVG